MSFSPAGKWTTACSPELQVVGRLPGISCESCRPVPSRPAEAGTPLGASRDHNICRSHLQGSLNYQTTTMMPVCSASYSVARSLPCSFPLPIPSNTKHGLLELSLYRMSGTYHGASVVPSSAPAPARQGGGTMWFDAHPGMIVPWVGAWFR